MLSRLIKIVHWSALAGVLGGCALSLPYQSVRQTSALDTPDAEKPTMVTVVITQATLDPQNLTAFDDHTQRVLAGMASHPGLLGYSARRQIFGNVVWTMTAWKSDVAVNDFVYSPVHQQAIRAGSKGLVAARFGRFELPASRLPLSWDEALALLETAPATIAY